MKRRLVLMLEWLTLWPTKGFLPVRSQRQAMAKILENRRRVDRRRSVTVVLGIVGADV